MAKVMDVKKILREAKGMYSPPYAACFQGFIEHISQKYHWSGSGSLKTKILHGSQCISMGREYNTGLKSFSPLTEEGPSWPFS